MPTTYEYQTTATLTQIANDLIVSKTMDDPIFKLFPLTPYNTSRLRWLIQDNYIGLMKLRGLGGEPTRVTRVGARAFESVPGYYGEFQTVDEVEMTERAAGIPANLNVPVSIADLVAGSQDQLTTRQVNRMKMITWLLALNQTFAVPLPEGGIGHQETYTGQNVTVSPLWSTPGTSTPLADLRNLQYNFGRGTSNMFNGMAQAWMNSRTANYFLSNTNSGDLGGKREANGQTINDFGGINILLGNQNAPAINIWDDGYINDAGTYTLYIPDGKVLVVGKRPNGETPGQFMMTRNAVNADMGARPYSEVIDRQTGPARQIPPMVEVHCGFNGGPVVTRPTQLITMTVG